MSRRKKWGAFVLAALLIAAAGAWYVFHTLTTGSFGTFTVSKETTYILEPLDEAGRPDYATAINQIMSQGVTPQNNANVLIWQAVGPTPLGEKPEPEVFRWLGISAPPVNGDYWQPLKTIVKTHVAANAEETWEILDRQMAQSMRDLWSDKQFPVLAEWLKKNEGPLALIVEASKRERLFSPLVPPMTKNGRGQFMDARLLTCQPCREFAMALAARALLRLNAGRVDDAWNDLLACHRLARLQSQGGTLIELLVAFVVDMMAFQADIAFANSKNVELRKLATCLQDIDRLAPMASVADGVGLADRFMTLDAIMNVHRSGGNALSGAGETNSLWANFMIAGTDWDEALRLSNQWRDRVVKALNEKNRSQRWKSFDTIHQELVDLKANRTKQSPSVFVSGTEKGKAIGNILVPLLMPAFRKLDNAADRRQQNQDNVRLAFALAMYQREHGRFPDKLAALAPKYIPVIPRDLFSGGDLVYRPSEKGYFLYSVGANGEDEDGRDADGDPPGDDISVVVPVPPSWK